MSGGKEIALSVEETNKLRAELGLRPLSTSPAAPPAAAAAQVHAPPAAPPAAAPRPRLSAAAAAVLGLGDDAAADDDDDADEEDAAAWVRRVRAQASAGAAPVSRPAKRPRPPSPPRDEHMTGARVKHEGLSALAEGEETVLTLADAQVLDDDGGGAVLVNAEERERIAAREAVRRRSGAARADLEYDPTDDAEFRAGGAPQGVLRKYDGETEVVGGAEAAAFRVGDGGVLEPPRPGFGREEVAARLRAAAGSVPVESAAAEEELKFQSDYASKVFKAKKAKKAKKSKKKRKKRGGEDDEGAGDVEPGADAGGGVQRRASVTVDDDGDGDGDGDGFAGRSESDDEAERLSRLKALRAAAVAREAREAREAEEDDEDDSTELQESLGRARRAAARARESAHTSSGAKAAFDAVSKVGEGSGGGGGGGGDADAAVVVTEADLFVRGIGVDLRTGESEPPDVFARENGATSGGDAPESPGASMEVEKAKGETLPDLPPDPTVADAGISQPMGLAHTLARLRNIGGLKRPKDQVGRVRDQRVDWTVPGGGRDVQLSYKDEQGRDCTAKEAFRIMSHKFHGKGPGQNKREAKMRRQLKDKELREASVADIAPLASVAALHEETRKTATAHIVLSGTAAIRDVSGGAAAGSAATPESADQSGLGDQVAEEGADDAPAKRPRPEEEIVAFSLGHKRRRH